MEAIVQRGYGEPEQVLHLEDRPDPVPGPGEVLVRVAAAGVNAADWHVVTGEPRVMRLAWRDLGGRRQAPGHDLAGRVEQVGPDAKGFAVGDLVVGAGRATFAELAVARPEHLALVRDGLDPVAAAALPMAATTAWQALHGRRPVLAGDRVLVTGASGGVGHLAVQVARALGAHVTGTCSTRNLELVAAAGAHEVIDYTAGEVPPDGERYDLVVHVAGPTPLRRMRRALRPGGALVMVSGDGGPWLGPLPLLARLALVDAVVRPSLRFLLATSAAEDLRSVLDLVSSGSVAPVVERTVDLVDAPAAVAHVRTGHTRGKTVVTVGG